MTISETERRTISATQTDSVLETLTNGQFTTTQELSKTKSRPLERLVWDPSQPAGGSSGNQALQRQFLGMTALDRFQRFPFSLEWICFATMLVTAVPCVVCLTCLVLQQGYAEMVLEYRRRRAGEDDDDVDDESSSIADSVPEMMEHQMQAVQDLPSSMRKRGGAGGGEGTHAVSSSSVAHPPPPPTAPSPAGVLHDSRTGKVYITALSEEPSNPRAYWWYRVISTHQYIGAIVTFVTALCCGVPLRCRVLHLAELTVQLLCCELFVAALYLALKPESLGLGWASLPLLVVPPFVALPCSRLYARLLEAWVGPLLTHRWEGAVEEDTAEGVPQRGCLAHMGIALKPPQGTWIGTCYLPTAAEAAPTATNRDSLRQKSLESLEEGEGSGHSNRGYVLTDPKLHQEDDQDARGPVEQDLSIDDDVVDFYFDSQQYVAKPVPIPPPQRLTTASGSHSDGQLHVPSVDVDELFYVDEEGDDDAFTIPDAYPLELFHEESVREIDETAWELQTIESVGSSIFEEPPAAPATAVDMLGATRDQDVPSTTIWERYNQIRNTSASCQLWHLYIVVLLTLLLVLVVGYFVCGALDQWGVERVQRGVASGWVASSYAVACAVSILVVDAIFVQFVCVGVMHFASHLF